MVGLTVLVAPDGRKDEYPHPCVSRAARELKPHSHQLLQPCELVGFLYAHRGLGIRAARARHRSLGVLNSISGLHFNGEGRPGASGNL